MVRSPLFIVVLVCTLCGCLWVPPAPLPGDDDGGQGGVGGNADAGGGVGGAGGSSPADGGMDGSAIDTFAPSLLGTAPSNDATSVGLSAPITLHFSEPIAPTSLSVTSTPAIVSAAPVFSNGDATVTITPVGDRQPNTKYTIEVVARDLDNNLLAMTGTNPFSFTTGAPPDTSVPTVQATTPGNNAMNVGATNLAVTVEFSEPVRQSSVRLTVNGGNFDIGAPTWPSANVAQWSTPGESYAPNTLYTFSVTASDLAGNAMAMPYVFKFTTVAVVTPPTVLRMFPANGATGVPRNSSIVIFFSEAMNTTAVEAALRINGSVRAGTASWDAAKKILRFTPTIDWATGTQSVSLAGSTDLAGNELALFFSSFVAGLNDTTAPTVSSTTPTAGQTDYGPFTSCDVATRRPRTIAITFDELMDPLSLGSALTVESPVGTPVAGSVSFSTNGRGVVFTPAAPLAYDRAYSVRVNATAKDLSGNALAALTLNFRTLKRVIHTLTPVLQDSGSITSSPYQGTQLFLNASIVVGETSTPNIFRRGVASFAITSTVPAGFVCINEAELTMTQLGVTGSPFAMNEVAVLELVKMGVVIAPGDYAAAAVAELPPVELTNSAAPGSRVLDVTRHVRYVLDPATVNGQTLRFRFRFTTQNAPNGVLDSVTFQTTSTNPKLVITTETR